jgi:alpha-1,3-rhamnosyltransferase
MKQPKVSVIVPCYNHERYILQCIESIINQTYQDFELIVIDDGSMDKSVTILKDLQSKYGFKLFLQENRGIAYTINRGTKEISSGEYITFCASDDYWSFNKLEKQVHFMENNRFYPMCYGKTYYVDESSTVLNNSDSANNKFKGGSLFDDIFLFRIHPPVNYIYRKSIFDEVGYFDENIIAEDYYMNLKISCKYNIGYLDEYLGFYRFINTPEKIYKFDKIADSHLMIIDDYLDHPLYKRAKSMVYLRKFDMFSGYSNLKREAFVNLFKCIQLWYYKRFVIAFVKLLFWWKK